MGGNDGLLGELVKKALFVGDVGERFVGDRFVGDLVGDGGSRRLLRVVLRFPRDLASFASSLSTSLAASCCTCSARAMASSSHASSYRLTRSCVLRFALTCWLAAASGSAAAPG